MQVVWDHRPRGTLLLLALIGSAVGVMEDMLGADGALRGRPTLSMHLEPMAAASPVPEGVGARPSFATSPRGLQ